MNQLPADFKTPLGMFYQWEKQQPDAIWLHQCDTAGDTTYSWAEAGRKARALAAGILSLGLEPGDKVGIYSTNTAKWVLTDLAIMMAGLVSVPIYATMPEDKIRYIADHSEMKMIFVGDQCALSAKQLAEAFQASVTVIGSDGQHQWDELLTLAKPVDGDPNWPFDRLWSISYTSGTTGKPKGVMHSFSSMPYSAQCLSSVSGMDRDSRFFSYLPLAHIAERCVVELHALYVGGKIGFNQSLETFTDDLKRIAPHYFNSVPRIWANLKAGIVAKLGEENWQRLLDDPAYREQVGKPILEAMGLGSVTWAQSGSAPIPPDLIRDWRLLGLPLVEGYGQTETMNGLFNSPDNFKIGTIGRILQPAKAKLSDEGELLLSSLGNMLGYYKDPEKTAETIVDGWIHTGDKATVDEDGFYTITGRVKDIFKTGKGKYVAPAPIEGKFARLTGVAQCCLVGRGMPQTLMLMVADEAIKPSVQQLEQHLDNLNNTLESHEKISHVIVCKEPWGVENGLLTHTLKMLRDNIENRYKTVIETAVSGGEPSVVIQEA